MLLFSNSSFILNSIFFLLFMNHNTNKTLQLLSLCWLDALVMLLRCRNAQTFFTNCYIHVKVCIHSFTTTTLKVRSMVESTYFAVKMKLINMQRQLLRKYILQRSTQKTHKNHTKNSPMYTDFSMFDARVHQFRLTIIRTIFPLVSFPLHCTAIHSERKANHELAKDSNALDHMFRMLFTCRNNR